MRLRTWLIPCFLSALSALTGCGGGGSGSDTGGGPQPNVATADVALTVSGSTTVAAGTPTVAFEIVISNIGADAARNVKLTAQFASGFTAVITGCTPSGGAVCPTSSGTFLVPSLPGNSSLRLQASATISSGAHGIIDNTIVVVADNDAQANNNSATFTVRIFTSDLAVSGHGPDTKVISGGQAIYSMQLTNLGPDPAENVPLQNIVGPGQTLHSISCSAVGGGQCPTTLGASMSVPTIPMGSTLTFLVTADVAPTTIGTVVNTMYVSQPGDPVASNNVASASGTTEVPIGAISFIQLQSDAGDYVGLGNQYTYTKATASLSLSANANRLNIDVAGDEHWSASIALPTGYNQLIIGTYQAARFADASQAGLDWGGEGRGCNIVAGTVIVDNVIYNTNGISELDLRFEQHCEGGSSALRGQIHWLASDSTTPPGPENPPPAGLWNAPSGATPSSGNYVYLQSDTGDYVGAGNTTTYTQASAVLNVSVFGARLFVGVNGDDTWTGNFQAMSSVSQLQIGYYGPLKRYPFNNPVRGGLDWGGNGRGCNTLSGWFVIDNVAYVNGSLTAIDLRFEQHCEGASAALRGKIHWIAGDSTAPPGPQNPLPTGLWDAPSGATPATGNYVYLQSDSADYIGGGQTLVYTQANSILGTTASGQHLGISVNGNESWTGDFQAMNSISQMRPGYYGGLQRYPFNNPVRGGLNWSGEGRGCNTLSGWFVIDNITFVGSTLTAIDLRFEQHCEGVPAALHGKIHWIVGDPTAPPGPQNPLPAGLWDAPSGTTPATGNYVYLQSDSGDYIGQGQTNLYTPSNASVTLSGSGRHANFNIRTNGSNWNGDFEGMNSITQLSTGYYGGLERWPFNNPVKGGLSWYGFSRGCNSLSGWFVVDSISYAGGNIASLDLRFEQRCEGLTPALHGKIHWVN